MTADSYGIPPIPSINTVKPIGNKKICPTCQSDNKSTDIKCTNCGGSLAGVRSQLVPPRPSEPGEQRGQNEHEVVKMHVPGMPRAAQSAQPGMIIPSVKPIEPKRRPISDDDVQVTEESHLSNVEMSADGLGL